jgi:hypothetical protein
MSLELLAWAKIGDRTEIRYHVGPNGVEFSIGGLNGLTLEVTEQGLENLVRVGISALQVLQSRYRPESVT